MEKLKVTIIAIGLMALFGFSAERNYDPPADKPVALVKKIVKEVTFRFAADKSDWEEAKLGSQLSNGGEVRTGTKSLALVMFIDGSGLLRVRENSILKIYGDKKDRKMNKNTFIERGVVGFDVNKQEEDEEFKFTTPTVVASIRGTEGYIAFNNQDSSSTIYLNTGSAIFTTLTGQQGTIVNGKTVTVTSDGQFQMRDATAADSLQFNNTTRTNSKQLKINTSKGRVIIDYLDNK